MSAVTASVCL